MSTIPSNLSSLVNNASPSTLPTNTSSTDYKTEFLTLLFTQLKNQDPTNPMDSTQMLSQQAQFESLEQMQNMNSNFVASIALQNTTQAASMLGKTVTGTVNNVSTTGLVQGVDFSSGSPMLVVLPTGATSTVQMSLSSVSEMSL